MGVDSVWGRKLPFPVDKSPLTEGWRYRAARDVLFCALISVLSTRSTFELLHCLQSARVESYCRLNCYRVHGLVLPKKPASRTTEPKSVHVPPHRPNPVIFALAV